MTAIVPTDRQLAARKSIHALEEMMLALPKDEQLDAAELTDHYFAPGIYARMMFIPAGSVLVGKIHKHETMNIVCKGKISVVTESGRMIFEGPCVMNSSPGIKKAGYAIEDTWFINIHATDETDLEKIEDEFIAKDYAEVEYTE